MIPAFLREAFARAEEATNREPVVVAPAAIEIDAGHDGPDLIQRYALVGIFTIMVVSALYFSKSVAMPVVAGIVFGLILGPVTDRLNRLGLPQGAAAAVVVLVGFLVVLALFAALAAPFAIWSDQLPGIVGALQDRLRALFDSLSSLARLTEGLAPTAPSVTVSEGSPWLSVAGYSSSAFGGLLIFLGTLYFYLASRRAFRARALKLCLGRQARQLAHEYLDEIESRVAAYFGVVTVVNLGMGAATGLIAWLAGLPFPILWAFGGFLLNFVAYVGPAVMTALLFGAGLVAMQNPWMALLPAAAYLLVHGVESNVVTPVAVGRYLTVAPFLVFVFIVFWLWLWGPAGAILSTPLLLIATATVEVVGAYRKAKEEEKAEEPAQPATLVIKAAPAEAAEPAKAG